jgi:hypothetical protein
MRLFQDEVEVGVLPDDAHCKLDEDKEYILDLACCPLGNEFCSGWCDYYTEDKE